jgi:putative nucleotidyltransferase with HDIG domain
VAPLDLVRAELAGTGAWLVGGAVRDRLLGRAVVDLDLAVPGDPKPAARGIARATGGAAFRLSDAFGAWRIVGPGHGWQVDLVPLRDDDIDADLAARDFTVNAMAEPLDAPGELRDPHGGRADLAARRLRLVGPDALTSDPLRALRAVRLAIGLDLVLEPATASAVTAGSPGLATVAPERIFAELRQVIASPRVRDGLALMEAHGVTAVVLPELLPLHGVDQSVYHHRDVHGHTLEVLDEVVGFMEDPEAAGFGEHAPAVLEVLRRPLADELTGGEAMRFAALLHDIAKPETATPRPDGRGFGFPGHDRLGAEVAQDVLRRLRASEKLVGYVAHLCRQHLKLGFLVHARPLDRRTVWRYMVATRPYEVETTALTVADRRATRGRGADEAIAAHLEVAREMLGHVFARRAQAPRPPLIRGDELAAELGIPAGPRIGELLAQLEEDRYVGEIATRADAVTRAAALLAGGPASGSPPGTPS